MRAICWYCWHAGRTTPATTDYDGRAVCENCSQVRSEEAHERFVANFYGSDSPVSVQERYNHEAAEARRRW